MYILMSSPVIPNMAKAGLFNIWANPMVRSSYFADRQYYGEDCPQPVRSSKVLAEEKLAKAERGEKVRFLIVIKLGFSHFYPCFKDEMAAFYKFCQTNHVISQNKSKAKTHQSPI